MIKRYNQSRPHRKMTPEYSAYINAKARCKPNHPDHEYYFDRGIEFKFTSFEHFYKSVGKRPRHGMLLDRIDNNKSYENGNLRWSTPHVSNVNKRMTSARIKHNKYASKKGAEVARVTGQAATIAHIRWHVNRCVRKENCKLCQTHR